LKVTVRAFGDLIKILGSEIVVELEPGSKIEDLALKLGEKAGKPTRDRIGDHDLTGPEFNVLLNGRNILTLEGLMTPLKHGDIVALFPPLVGG